LSSVFARPASARSVSRALRRALRKAYGGFRAPTPQRPLRVRLYPRPLEERQQPRRLSHEFVNLPSANAQLTTCVSYKFRCSQASNRSLTLSPFASLGAGRRHSRPALLQADRADAEISLARSIPLVTRRAGRVRFAHHASNARACHPARPPLAVVGRSFGAPVASASSSLHDCGPLTCAAASHRLATAHRFVVTHPSACQRRFANRSASLPVSAPFRLRPPPLAVASASPLLA